MAFKNITWFNNLDMGSVVGARPSNRIKETVVKVIVEDGHYFAVGPRDNTICYDSPTACIQEAINYVLNQGGGTVELGPGDYYFPTVTSVPPGNALIAINLQNYTWSSFRLRGHGYGTRLHLPVNNTTSTLWMFTIGVPSASANAAVNPLPEIEGITFVNDMNNGSAPFGAIVTSGGGNIGNGIILRDIQIIDNPKAASGIQEFYNIWFNNMYGVLVEGFTFLSNNSSVGNPIAFDSVTLGKVIGAYLFHNLNYGGFTGVAFAPCTGTILIDDAEVYGFNIVVGCNGTDNLTTVHISNSILGMPRSGSQEPSGSATAAFNQYLIAPTGNNFYIKAFIENSIVSMFMVNMGNQSGSLYMQVVNSWLYNPCVGSFLTGTSNNGGHINIAKSRLSVNELAGACGGAPLDNPAGYGIVVEDSDLYLNENSYTTSSGLSGTPGIVNVNGTGAIYIRRNEIVFLGQTNTLVSVTASNTSGIVIIEDNNIYTFPSSQTSQYLLGLPGSGYNIPQIIIRNNNFILGSGQTVSAYNIAPSNPSNLIAYGNLNAPTSYSITPSVPSSGTSVTNTYPFKVQVCLNGGTVTQITISGNTVFSNSSGASMSGQCYILNPGDSITITYSSAPTWAWIPA